VAAIAGKQIKHTVLELGGSDPFVVMPSAPLTETVEHAVKARVQNNGQSCIAAKRFIVHTAIYDEFEKLFVEAFRGLRVGDPMSPETDIGPLAQKQAVETLEKQLQAGIKSGAKILIGGKRRPGPGFYFEPTVLANIPVGDAFSQEELFGPVAMLFRASDLNHALEIANATPFGLGASIWTQDKAEQQRGISELQAGQVFVNSMVASQPALPFGGIKQSGYGREMGDFGIREFMNAKSVRIAL
jgi:succinate-semialdehyde dehydrogenase/glutarate-semialdehyde dehydrogenase